MLGILWLWSNKSLSRTWALCSWIPCTFHVASCSLLVGYCAPRPYQKDPHLVLDNSYSDIHSILDSVVPPWNEPANWMVLLQESWRKLPERIQYISHPLVHLGNAIHLILIYHRQQCHKLLLSAFQSHDSFPKSMSMPCCNQVRWIRKESLLLLSCNQVIKCWSGVVVVRRWSMVMPSKRSWFKKR